MSAPRKSGLHKEQENNRCLLARTTSKIYTRLKLYEVMSEGVSFFRVHFTPYFISPSAVIVEDSFFVQPRWFNMYDGNIYWSDW
jgi:hypothetical protein